MTMGSDTEKTANAKMVTKLLFRLLPVQILLAAVGAVNGIVSSFFAISPRISAYAWCLGSRAK